MLRIEALTTLKTTPAAHVVSGKVTQDILLQQLRDLLKDGVAHFSYTTSKGEVREAFGTLSAALIPQSAAPKGTSTRERDPDLQSYFDLGKMDWRSFNVNNLLGYVRLT